MNDLMYFGTREKMSWVKCPDSGMGSATVGWTANGTYLNGGGYVLSSSTGHKEYSLSWNFVTHAQAQVITNYHEGVWGQGPFYFLDPAAMSTNVLPSYWATPRLAVDDAPSLVINRRPTLSTPTSALPTFPSRSATYEIRPGDKLASLYIPVPPGHTIHIGAYGSSSGNARVTANGLTVPLLYDTDPSIISLSRTGSSGVNLTLEGTGFITLNAMIVKVLPDGVSPQREIFYNGQGHSGCNFKSAPSRTTYSAPDAIDYVALTAEMIETGAWL